MGLSGPLFFSCCFGEIALLYYSQSWPTQKRSSLFPRKILRKLCETSFLDLFLDTESRQRFLDFLHTDETSADLAMPRGLRVFLQGAHGPVSMDLFHTRIPSTIGKVAQEKERQCDRAQELPSGYVKIAIENGPYIVDFPMKHGDFPWLR